MNTAALRLAYPCVIFDLDGTLLDTRAPMLAVINDLLDELGRDRVDAAQVAPATHHGLAAMLHAALASTGTLPPAALLAPLEIQLRQRYLRRAAGSVRCFPQAAEVLQALRERGAWLAICSNQDEMTVRALLQAHGLLRHFNQIVGGDTLPGRKPDPLPLRWLMQQAGGGPLSAVMVGDSEVDAECAARSGAAAIIMSHGYGGGRIAAPHLPVADFTRLQALLLP